MPPKSKRQRKQKDKFSLKVKAKVTDEGVTLEEDDSNALILPAKREATEKTTTDDVTTTAPPEKHLSKSQQRKLRKIQEEKERRERRAQVYETLSQHQMAQDQLSLLRSMSERGQKDTKRKALKRALQLQRAGVDLPEDTQLYRQRKTGGHGHQEEEEEESDEELLSGDDDNEEEETRAALGRSKNGVQNNKSQQPAAKRHKSDPTQQSEPAALSAEVLQAATKDQLAALRQSVNQAKMEIEQTEGQYPGTQRDEDTADPSGLPLAGRQPVPAGPARVVHVTRDPQIESIRSGLPILGMEQEIMEAITNYDVVVLCGETGCGKTTQVPQFLFEAGFGSRLFVERQGAIGVTQPRRVAAASTASRVAEELGSSMGDVVGYQVRYDRKVGTNTAIKFMTDGILLRELREDFLLRRYSVIIVDEAHERSLNTDILLGMLSRIVSLRRSLFTSQSSSSSSSGDVVYPLKLIVMSATLRIEDFVGNRKLFPVQPPVVNVPARQYPVTVHFSKKTELHDYVGAAYKKTCQIHRMLPPGGILVFVTGQREVEHLCHKLRKTFDPRNNKRNKSNNKEVSMVDTEEDVYKLKEADFDLQGEDAAELDLGGADYSSDDYDGGDGGGTKRKKLRRFKSNTSDDDEDSEQDNNEDASDESGDEEEVVVLGGDGLTPEEIAAAEKRFEEQFVPSNPNKEDEDSIGPVHVLPLYAMLPSALQAKVFKPPPAGHRLIIVATNAAETSITIPGIRYVVDAGRSKQRLLEQTSGLARFEVRWVSKASAEQRAGRAGRTGPGHCYRLFSSALYNDLFPQHTPPEIVNTALEGVVLSLKSLGVEKVQNFPFPTTPDSVSLTAAEKCLIALSAIDRSDNKLTQLGRAMSVFPVSPRHARMLLEVLNKHAEDIASQLSHQKNDEKEDKKSRKKKKAMSGVDVLPYAIALAAALSVESPFVHIDGLETDDKKDEEEGEDGNAVSKAEKEEAARKRHSARNAQARLRVQDSDALSALSALCAFEAAGQDESFCRSHFLHYRNLKEAAALRQQLARTIIQHRHTLFEASSQLDDTVGGNELSLLNNSPPAYPPPPLILHALRRALTAGWSDQIAKRVRSLDHIHTTGSHSKKKARAVRYRSIALEEDVFLHPNSALHTSAPEFVVYNELVRTVKRPYMAGVTSIEPQWLPSVAAPLCTFSEPLLDPAPYYNPSTDSVMAWRDVTYGPLLWPLPRYPTQHPVANERCAVFAAALLEGKVCPVLQELRGVWAMSPAMASRPEMRAHRRVSDLIAALVRAKVDCRVTLSERWKQDENFLKNELRAWMKKGGESVLDKIWRRMLSEALGLKA